MSQIEPKKLGEKRKRKEDTIRYGCKRSNNSDGILAEDHGTSCRNCKISWTELTEKCRDWIQCDIGHEYICSKCYDKRNIFTDDNFLQYLHQIINIKVRFPFNCPLGRLSMSENLSVFSLSIYLKLTKHN